MISFWLNSKSISQNIFIPKYYNPEIISALSTLSSSHVCLSIKSLVDEGTLSCNTGDEIGKNAYGTGNIPFVRTSDISNWEIKTAPKQGVSLDIYQEYQESQDVMPGDILFVRDGTYLIGNNCFITEIDKEILYQSHIIKIRVNDKAKLDPTILFLSLNSEIAQKQMRSFQFTADIIDTIGNRFYEIILPIPKSEKKKRNLITKAEKALETRAKDKAFVKNAGKIIEQVLVTNSIDPISVFLNKSYEELAASLVSETVTAEFGEFEAVWKMRSQIRNDIFIPKYYDPSIEEELTTLSRNCEIVSFGDLKLKGILDYYTGDEIGKMAYGTGNIPFLRTSDFSNWEIKHDPKQGISEEIYLEYKDKEDVQPHDILLVRDGTYLVGSSCIITKNDSKALFCGGLYKIRSLDEEYLNPFLLLALLNSYIVKRQIRTKQFTRDVIDTIGNRLDEVFLPIPKNKKLKGLLSTEIEKIITARIDARMTITKLSKEILEQ